MTDELIQQVVERIRKDREFAAQLARELGLPEHAKYTILTHLGKIEIKGVLEQLPTEAHHG